MSTNTNEVPGAILAAVARGWCTPGNSNKVMDEELASAIAREVAALVPAPVEASELPPPELTWLYTHCRAIGMDCKSDSGKWEHDIALYTANQKARIEELERAALASQVPGEAVKRHWYDYSDVEKAVVEVEEYLKRWQIQTGGERIISALSQDYKGRAELRPDNLLLLVEAAKHTPAATPTAPVLAAEAASVESIDTPELRRYNMVAIQNNGYDWNASEVVSDTGEFVKFEDAEEYIAALIEGYDRRIAIQTEALAPFVKRITELERQIADAELSAAAPATPSDAYVAEISKYEIDGMYHYTKCEGQQHDTGRVYFKNPANCQGSFFASTSSPDDAKTIAMALNRAILAAPQAAQPEAAPAMKCVKCGKEVEGDGCDDCTACGGGHFEPSAHAPVVAEGGALEELNRALVLECERAIAQRDTFLKTGISTASHGGSHDTCFPAILRKYSIALKTAQAKPDDPMASVMRAAMDAPRNIAARMDMTPKGNMSVEFPPTAQAKQPDLEALHKAIEGLVPESEPNVHMPAYWYKLGFKSARNAAANLVAAFLKEPT